MNFFPLLILGLIGTIIAKGISQDKIIFTRTSPEQRLANLRSQIGTAFADGNTQKYTELQREIEILELSQGL